MCYHERIFFSVFNFLINMLFIMKNKFLLQKDDTWRLLNKKYISKSGLKHPSLTVTNHH